MSKDLWKKYIDDIQPAFIQSFFYLLFPDKYYVQQKTGFLLSKRIRQQLKSQNISIFFLKQNLREKKIEMKKKY